MSRKAGTISEETKTRLLQAATEEFAEYGYEKSSLRRICKNAEVTTGALYFFFSGQGRPVSECDRSGHGADPADDGVAL